MTEIEMTLRKDFPKMSNLTIIFTGVNILGCIL